jgi:hypothetical protein
VRAVLGTDSRLQPALIDLKRMGPHFAIAGPPLSGKTTALWSWVLSLAERYAPAQAMVALVDLQGRLSEYGGTRTLGELPHVVATVAELEQLGDLVTRLRSEGEALAAGDAGRALFVVIDNFDDFSEELEGSQQGREQLRELAALARRYGRDGLHFIIAGALDGTANELRKRVQSCGYGLALRTEQALSALRVQRLPAALRDRELPVGRGYLVKAGQPTLLQVATPYTSSGAPPAGADGEEAARNSAALDCWIQQLCATYPDQRASWSNAPVGPGPNGAAAAPQSPKLQRIVATLQRGLRQELEHLKGGNGHEPLLTAGLVAAGPEAWHNEELLVSLLRELWVRQQVKDGMPGDNARVMLATLDLDSLIFSLEDALPSEQPQSP